MPIIVDSIYKEWTETNIIKLHEPADLEAWLNKVSETKMPRKANQVQCKCALIAQYYLGARPGELIELKPADIEKVALPFKKEGRKRTIKTYLVRLKTLKKGDKIRQCPLPIDKNTTFLYNSVKKQYPEMNFFYGFRHAKKNEPYTGTKNRVKWITNKQIYIRELDGSITQQLHSEHHDKTYQRNGAQISQYLKALTGHCAYYFRHHRLSYMAAKGASDSQLMQWKGAAKVDSVAPYKHMSSQHQAEMVSFFE